MLKQQSAVKSMRRRFTRHERGTWPARVSYAILAIAVVFPLVLVIHSLFANRELREMRSIYLRDLAATIAARLEVMPTEKLKQGDFDELLETNPLGACGSRVSQL